MSKSEDGDPPETGVAGHRRLQSYGSPDLEVAVGETEQLYHYHSLILASQSLYVDTLLSSPAATREQEKMRISFPDINVETWNKMMKFLKPSAVHPTLDELKLIIPLYDKYQFNDALHYCDELLSVLIPKAGGWCQDHEYIQGITQLASIIWPLNSFPLSKPLALKWAKRCFEGLRFSDEDMIRLLMPLVENDDDTMHSAVSTFLGCQSKEMSMNKMRDVTKLPDFPEQCALRCNQLSHLDDQVERLPVDRLSIKGAGEEVDGDYEYETSRDSECGYSHNGGVAQGTWKKVTQRRLYDAESDEEANDSQFIVAPVDFFGNAWEVYLETSSSDGNGVEQDKLVLYRWESGNFNSLVPPLRGWERMLNDGGSIAAKKMWLGYTIRHRKY